MVAIYNSFLKNYKLILFLRIFSGLVWFGTVIRRILVPNFEERIIQMSKGTTILPSSLLEFAVSNWELIFLIVLTFEIIVSISLLLGIFARFGSLLASINGFAIGMAGLGIGIVDLLIPWSVATITLILFLFTHPGIYKGIDEKLQNKNLPKVIRVMI